MSYRFFPLLFFWHFSVVTVYKRNYSLNIMKHVAAFFLKNRCFWCLSWNVLYIVLRCKRFWFCGYYLYRATLISHISIYLQHQHGHRGRPHSLSQGSSSSRALILLGNAGLGYFHCRYNLKLYNCTMCMIHSSHPPDHSWWSLIMCF